jgi:hypothetical protein
MTSTNPQLSFTTSATQLGGVLRADRIRFDTLISLAVAWADEEGREHLEACFDQLADAMRSPREGELDRHVEAIEDAAGMDDAHVEVSMSHLLRLRAELDAVIAATAGRFNPAVVRTLPTQREVGAA